MVKKRPGKEDLVLTLFIFNGLMRRASLSFHSRWRRTRRPSRSAHHAQSFLYDAVEPALLLFITDGP
jgi:hypothetical protein